jgi:hypothetical protein
MLHSELVALQGMCFSSVMVCNTLYRKAAEGAKKKRETVWQYHLPLLHGNIDVVPLL